MFEKKKSQWLIRKSYPTCVFTHLVSTANRNRAAYSFPFAQPSTKVLSGNSLAVQWFGLCVLTAESPGSIPGPGTKIPQATQCGQKKKKKFSAKPLQFTRQKVQ